MKVAFRVDASPSIGGGHVMRCLALAGEILRSGGGVTFLTCKSNSNLDDALLASGADVRKVSETPLHILNDTGWKLDVEETISALGSGWDWIVVDHYGLDFRWHRLIRKVVKRILIIEDIEGRQHDCNVYVDQNLRLGKENRYTPRVPDTCKCLLGPKFALLRDEFRVTREKLKRSEANVPNLLVAFGGSDPSNVTQTSLVAIERIRPLIGHIDVVVGLMNPNVDLLRELCRKLEDCTLHLGSTRIAELMSAAHISIGGAGVMTWERCALGLPAILISLAQNQVDIARAVANAGAANYLGDYESVSAGEITKALRSLVLDPVRRTEMSQAACKIVDGDGAARVVRTMMFH